MAEEIRHSVSQAIEREFTRVASWLSNWAGRPAAFMSAVGLMILWAVLGPFVHYSEVWQLSVNTGTTIVTFLMVFIIQNSQNRDTRAIQIKIDELIRATKGASNSLLDIEILSATEIDALHKRYRQIAERAQNLGYDFDTGSPELPPALDDATRAVDKATGKVAKGNPNGAKKPVKRRRVGKATPAASAG